MATVVSLSKNAALQRCLNSPYLHVDPSRQALAQEQLSAARDSLTLAQRSFAEDDEAAGLKQAWGAIFRAGRALVYKAGYEVSQLRCMEVVLRAHYAEQISEQEIAEMRLAQELSGPPEAALARAQAFINKVASLV